MEKEKLLSKMKKLMALAEGAKEVGSIHEAEAAMKRLQALMHKHEVSMGEVEKADRIIVQDSSVKPVMKDYRYYSKDFESALIGVIARAFMCRVINNVIGGKAYQFIIIGKAENIEVVKYVYSVCKHMFISLAKQAYKDKFKEIQAVAKEITGQTYDLNTLFKMKRISSHAVFYKSFLHGAIRGLHEKFEAEKQKEKGKLREIILVNDSDIAEYMAQEFPNLSKGGARTRLRDGDAYASGQKAGRNASINAGVNSSGKANIQKQLK